MTTLPDETVRIRALNDLLRQNAFSNLAAIPGRFSVMVTEACCALSDQQLNELLEKVATFTAFEEGNDPYQEHDFGAIAHAGSMFYFKIDYYDLDLSAGSPNPADTACTVRVLTVLRADEW
jgi:hypothetical protein